MSDNQPPHSSAEPRLQQDRRESLAAAELTDRLQTAYKRVLALLDADRVDEACQAIRAHASAHPLLKNLSGVCLLRKGDTSGAVDTFRQLVLDPRSLLIRKDVPVEFKINFATALLLSGQVTGAQEVLHEMSSDDYDAIQHLRISIANWRQELTLWERLQWTFGSTPSRPVKLNFPPGDIPSSGGG